MLDLLLKSIIDSDNAAVVICDLNSVIVYMNPAAVSRYHKDLTGKSLKDCHNAKSNEMIDRVLGWFKKVPRIILCTHIIMKKKTKMCIWSHSEMPIRTLSGIMKNTNIETEKRQSRIWAYDERVE